MPASPPDITSPSAVDISPLSASDPTPARPSGSGATSSPLHSSQPPANETSFSGPRPAAVSNPTAPDKSASISLGGVFESESANDKSLSNDVDKSNILDVSRADVNNSVVGEEVAAQAGQAPARAPADSSSSEEEESGSESSDDDEGFANNSGTAAYSNPFPTSAKPVDLNSIKYVHDDVEYTLPLACTVGNFPITVLLWGMYAAKGVSPMTVDEDGNNPLHFAALCSRDTSEVVDFLFQQTNGMDVNKNKLIDSRNVDEETPLIRAATKGNLSMIKCLIRNGADIGAMDANKNTVIANLARNGHLWALHFVLSLCPPHVARTLLSQADVDNHTALDWACYKGHTNVAEYLMYRGIEPTSVDTNGRNCLHWAAKEGMAETASYLVAIGMDPLAKDNDGNSPAMFALTNWELYEAMMISPVAKCGYRGGATMGDDAAFKPWCCGTIKPVQLPPDLSTPGSLRGPLSARVQKSLSGLDTHAGLNPCYGRANPTRNGYMFFFAAVTMAVWAVFIFLPFYYTPAVVLVLVWMVKTIKANIERLEKAYSAKAGHKIKLDGFMPRIMVANEHAIGFWLGCALTFLLVCLTAIALDVPGDGFSVSDINTNKYLATFVFVAEAAKQSPVLFATTSACVLLMIVSWAVLVYVYRDPGTVYEDRAKTYSQLFEDVASSGSEPDPRKWCTTTLVRKPLRAKYDAPTGLLVARHDHFCVWLDTAVGFGNHRVFMVFVFFQVASHYLFATFGWMNIVAFLEAQSATDFCDVTTLLFSPRVWGLFVLTLCATICALGLSFLLGQQTDGAFTNITTNERINKKRYNWLLDDEGKRFVNRFDTGSLLANFTEFLTKSKDYTRTYDLPPVRTGAVCSDGCCDNHQQMVPLVGGAAGAAGAGGGGHVHNAENRV